MRWLLLGLGVCGLVLVAISGSSGCLVKDPLYCHLPDHPCVDPARPVCDVNGQFEESDHIKNTCIPTPANCPVEICGCTPGELIACDQDSAVRCGADGVSSTREACAMGCDSSIGGCKCMPGDSKCEAGALEVCQPNGAFSAPSQCPLGCASDGKRCVDISASNGLNAALDAPAARADFTLGTGASFDTTSGTVLDGNGSAVLIPSVVVTQPGAPAIRAFVARSITLHGAHVTGTNAFAIVADETIEIDGPLDLRPTATASGPGTSSSAACRGVDLVAVPAGSTSYSPGAGGAGHAMVGGAGGKYGTTAGGAGGATYSTAANSPLLGGCVGGGLYNNSGAVLSAGGLGGGAIQLVARRAIRIVNASGALGVINAGGGGGGGGGYDGGGGGAGGSVLLEAPTVLVDGSGVGVFVNGGGSGCGGVAGQSGQSSTAAATSGCGTTNGGGGTGTQSPAPGQDICPSPGACNFGGFAPGGGGAAGLLRVNTANGSFAASNGATISAKSSVGMIGTR